MLNVAAVPANKCCAILADFADRHRSVFAFDAVKTWLPDIQVKDVGIHSNPTDSAVDRNDQSRCVLKATLGAHDDGLIKKFVNEWNAALRFALSGAGQIVG